MWTTKGSFNKYYNLARCVWGILVVVALLSRAVIPAGMMPDFKSHDQGIFQLTICSGDGMKTIDVPADDFGSTDKPHSTHTEPPCPYAVAVSTANIVLAILVILFLEVGRVLFIGSPIVRLWSTPFLPNIYPRAPPCLS